MPHYPVMLPDVLDSLAPQAGGVYVDGTFGAGGYTKAILEAASCTVVAIDRDLSAADMAQSLKDKYGARLIFVHGCFGDVEQILGHAGFKHVDGFVLDLGVSSMQLDRPERGFSFRFDGPLDMRMDQSYATAKASDVVNRLSERELADLIYLYGQEKYSRKIAKAIVARRAQAPFETTFDLANLVRAIVPKSKDEIDPATRTFQALRVYVNDEMGELKRALAAAEKILRVGGRLVVVSFHSLEDGLVKNFFRGHSGYAPRGSRHMPEVSGAGSPVFDLPFKKPLTPKVSEVKVNPRSRSARLRLAVKIDGGET